ncbi:hypothetical protein M441DRAFT_154327 [Trichoderma asperellum CBS 433.97]|uniref:Uncharacterized protein n=1 Tax=Trichoderma asperellum (strain ATCC 204424 / CBS 433.97 / NBRC 101777) TaxID=1042311 RepID=A0A2T3YR90_TRIA4|nr:hypothetical protein M441DRAFT_154327 [Trichoderma asperellum CBS 433.97]PTB35039.1 hypothetical protein M441DRAFT_154327 [Trichoderma asperellum CBS 433.97]
MKRQYLSLLAFDATAVLAAPGIQLGEDIEVRDNCPHDNLLRCLIASPSIAIPFCSSSANVLISLPTVTVTVTPTSFVTATDVTTDIETVTDTSIVLLTVSPSSTAAEILTSSPPEKRERKKYCPAPNCIRALNPNPSSASHGCSCFSGSYLATASTFTSTITAPTVTKASQTLWRTKLSTATVIVTMYVYVRSHS